MANNLFKDSPGSPTPNSAVSVVSDKAAEWNKFQGNPDREHTTTDEAAPGKIIPCDNPQTYTEQARTLQQSMVSTAQQKGLDKLASIQSFDWKAVPPPMLAQMLIQIPFKGSGTDPDYYLQPFQAMIFAMRCYELGLSPFSNEVWFNPRNNKVNCTFEGKLKLARMNGLNLSPPVFTRIPADAAKPLVAYHCKIHAPSGDCEYTAYLKDWQVTSSPVWKSKPEHMLQLRAAEKCLSFATGSGASELPDDRDLEVGGEAKAVLPEIAATEFREAK